jgi:hypothetical protein
LSPPFVKRPSKRIYPDYYKAIANPIGLEDIKKTIDDNRYPRLEHVKAALDLCFENCMNYNMDGSGLYIDAKELKVCRIPAFFLRTPFLLHRSNRKQ